MKLLKTDAYKGFGNPNYGKKHSAKSKAKMALNSPNRKLNVTSVLLIKNLLLDGKDHQYIANLYNVNRTVITRISNGTRWASITGGAVFTVEYENGKRKLSDIHRQRIGEKHKGMKYRKIKRRIK